ncbi:MAG: HEAT repeat domain-containing protein [Candidatus Omnitrophota bacterium]
MFILQQLGFAQISAELNIAGHLSALRNPLVIDKFRPLHLRYLSYDTLHNNFRLLLDKGGLENPKTTELENTSKELLKYFFIGISLPNNSFWVNLRPDADDNIIDDKLAQTDIGKIMLESDLQLKKDTAKATSPETPEGREYWDKLYSKAGELFGSENITIPTLTRPWIVPDEIIIRETTDSAYIYKATLRVMLEQDYLKNDTAYNFKDERLKQLNEYSSQLIRELIIPKLTKEVNISKRYAPLRQVYYSLILAQWFKARFAGKDAPYSQLIDMRKMTNLTSQDSWSKTTFFREYQKSFKDGEYNIKEPVSTPFGQTIRSYFSGGEIFDLGRMPSPGATTTITPTGSSISVLPAASSPIFNHDKILEINVTGTTNPPEIGEAFLPNVLSSGSSPIITNFKVEWHISRLKSIDPAVRRVAIVDIGNIGPAAHAAVPALINALGDSNWECREAAAEALVKIGPAAIPALINALGNDNFNVRKAAAKILVKIGPVAVPALIKALGDKRFCYYAAEALGSIGPLAQAAVPALINALNNALNDKDYSVCYSIIVALSNIGFAAKDAVPVFIKALGASNWLVRYAAVQALGNIGPAAQAAIPALIKVSNDPDARVREAVPLALKKIQSETGSSSPVGTPVEQPETFGGIDFRALPIVTQAIGKLNTNLTVQSLNDLKVLNLDEEWYEIQNMLKSGIIPLAERLKEYVQASCLKGALAGMADKVVLCISDILRQEEERCCGTDPLLKDILVVLESTSSPKELKDIFTGVHS